MRRVLAVIACILVFVLGVFAGAAGYYTVSAPKIDESKIEMTVRPVKPITPAKVRDKIAALPSAVTLEDETAVKDARRAYNSLSDEQKAQVTNFADLEAAEAEIKNIRDRAAAQAVIDAISALPSTLTLDDEAQVKAASKAYNALTADQKLLVTNASDLEAAIEEIKRLRVEAGLPEEDEEGSELSVHFFPLGNDKAGDCVYIKAGEVDILIDGGSATTSLSTIRDYVDQYVTDGVFEYAFVTHADLDHIANFAGTTKENTSLFDFYNFGTIIDFALSDKTSAAYSRYLSKRDKEVAEDGAKHFTALQCYNNEGDGAQRRYDLNDDTYIDILYNYYYEYESSDENNYSVCFLLTHGEHKFLFTGDLEKEGEAKLVENNVLPEVDFYKAGHHGSKTSTTPALMSVVKPKICVASCVAGSVEYTQNLDNTFPTQEFINNIAPYTDRVYVPAYVTLKQEGGKYKNDEYGLLNGTIVIRSIGSDLTVECSNNSVLLKDTEWFAQYRATPSAWA